MAKRKTEAEKRADALAERRRLAWQAAHEVKQAIRKDRGMRGARRRLYAETLERLQLEAAAR